MSTVKNRYALALYHRPVITSPVATKRMVLHSCCAPCSGEVIEAVIASGFEIHVFFYNPNIHPKQEYEFRKNENIRLCNTLGISFYEADYDTDNWFARVKGLEWSPERGARCSKCFDMRFARTALYAYENGYPLFSSCLGISRWKNMQQINTAGHMAASAYSGVQYWDYNWRKQGGAGRMIEIAKKYGMYQQEYCGCVYSLRDTNLWRRKNNRPAIRIGEKYYGYTQADIIISSADKNSC